MSGSASSNGSSSAQTSPEAALDHHVCATVACLHCEQNTFKFIIVREIGMAKFKRSILTGAIALLTVGTALAEQWPARPVKLIVPFPVGGSTDVVGRVIAKELSDRLGQPVVVDNRGGASGTIGSELLARMTADGYSILLSNVGSQGVGPSLFSTVKYDVMKDFTHIAMIGTFPNVLIAHPSAAARTVDDLVKAARAAPGKISYATSGNGSTNHFMGELLKFHAGVQIVHVPYRGAGPALTDLIGRQIEYMFDSMPSAAQHIASGRVVAIAVSGSERSPAQPGVPTFRESGFPAIEISNWFGLSSPTGVPAAVVARLNAETATVLARDDVARKLRELGLEPKAMSAADFSRYVGEDVARWRAAVRDTGIRAE
jgi:tripartite-type tricarboxylate transporter receptor subunit TctC